VIALKTIGRHYRHNIGRCDILFSSLRQFAEPETIGEVLVIVPSNEIRAIEGYARNWHPFRITVVDESKYLDIFRQFSKFYQVRPWHRQQIIKLFAAGLVATEFFLVVDPDMFATKRFSARELVRADKAVMDVVPRRIHSKWWQASAGLLNLPADTSDVGMSIMPAIFSRTICSAVQQRLRRMYKIEWYEVLLRHFDIDWTEGTLYYLVAESDGLLDRFHFKSHPSDHYRLHNPENCWWNRATFSPQRCFEPGTPGIFSVIQSNTHMPPSQIRTMLSPYFKIDAQPYDAPLAPIKRAIEIMGAICRRVHV
jgi:hypothetical protein